MNDIRGQLKDGILDSKPFPPEPEGHGRTHASALESTWVNNQRKPLLLDIFKPV
jgi:hypothetical protein